MDNPYAPPQTPLSAMTPTAELLPVLDGVQFPLTFRFKIFSLAPTVRIQDATGRPILTVRQKLFKFKEHVEVFADEARTRKAADIQADRIIDFSARYAFTDGENFPIGSVRRLGGASLWKASYDVLNPSDQSVDYIIREANPWTKLIDGILGGIPFLSLITVWILHPSYLARSKKQDGIVMKFSKQPSFMEGKFLLEKFDPNLSQRETMNLILAFFMLAFLERGRG